VKWVVSQLADNLVFNREYDLAHEGLGGFALDMSWFKNDVIGVIYQFAHPNI
jgi:hypothetical protein